MSLNKFNHFENLFQKTCSKMYIVGLTPHIRGTLLKQYKQCGKNNCRCHQDKKYWHGPYWIWTRKENGKTITKTLNQNQSQNQIQMVKKAFKNMKEIDQLVEKWKMLSLQHLEKIKPKQK